MSSIFSDGFYKAIFDACSDAIYVIDPQSSQIVDANTRAWLNLGMTREKLLRHSVVSLQNEIESEEHWKIVTEEIYKADPYTFIGRHCREDGSFFPVEVYTSLVEFEGRELFISIARNLDLTTSQREEFRAEDSKLTYALNEAADGLWDWNVATGEVYFSPQLKRMLSFLPQEMSPTVDTWLDLIHDGDRTRVLGALNDHLSGAVDSYKADYKIRNSNGEFIWVRDRGRVCQRDEEGKPTRVVGMCHDITHSKKLEDQLRQQASHDDLTGLLNRRAGYIHFKQQLSYAQRYKQKLSVCLLDLDHFKSVNDNYGHLVGDTVLTHFVDLMTRTLRKSDSLMRWGGEEFFLLLPNTDTESALKLISQLKDKIKENPVPLEDRELNYTFSAGLAGFPCHSQTFDGLIKCADDALYKAKESGRDLILISTDDSETEQKELF